MSTLLWVGVSSIVMVMYRLLELLLSESRMLDSLNDLGIEPSAHAALIGMPVHRSESNQVVLDVRSKSVVVRDATLLISVHVVVNSLLCTLSL